MWSQEVEHSTITPVEEERNNERNSCMIITSLRIQKNGESKRMTNFPSAKCAIQVPIASTKLENFDREDNHTHLHKSTSLKKGDIFQATSIESNAFITKREAVPVLAGDTIYDLAAVVLRASTAAQAALAGMKHAKVWHAKLSGILWRPSENSGLGPGRGPFYAAFYDEDETHQFFDMHPDATPLFVLWGNYEPSSAYVWHEQCLRKIPTRVYSLGR